MNEWAMYAVSASETVEVDRDRLVATAETYVAANGGFLGEEFVDTVDGEIGPWVRRPQAQRLLAFVADPRCGALHVVIPEPSRAFGTECLRTAAVLLEHHGVELHLSTVGALGAAGLTKRRVALALAEGDGATAG